MKFLHIADLHIGKRVGEFSMLEDQRHILQQILQIADDEKPTGILIAGDVYDKSLPSAEAVELLDDFLTELVVRKLAVFMVSGNHDSPERLNFGSRIMLKNGLHIAGVFDGAIRKEVLTDENDNLNIYLLPFLKPAIVKPYFDMDIESYDDAVQAVIRAASIDSSERNIIITHQFVTNGAQQPERSDSESISVGGMDNVDVSAFADFDYVAIGHLHGPQGISRDSVRYAGSPLKYSFSEARQRKSITIVECAGKGNVQIRMIPLTPLRDMREIKGPIAELLRIGVQDKMASQDYIHATLTDENEIYDAIGQLRPVYPNLMHLDFENSKTRQLEPSKTAASGNVACKNPMELFAEFYQNQNNLALTVQQQQVLQTVFEQAGGTD